MIADPRCSWCAAPLVGRRDRRFCSKRCRQASWRFGGEVQRIEVDAAVKRLAYADPPYPGLSKRYYGDHPDYAGEVDHARLLSRLQDYDGWALSTSAEALPMVLDLLHRGPFSRPYVRSVRVAAWIRGALASSSRGPRSSWEPVLYRSARRPVVSRSVGAGEGGHVDDSLVLAPRARTTDPGRVIGAKPAGFLSWMFRLVGAAAGDDFVDLFPGSGGASRAWRVACGVRDEP